MLTSLGKHVTRRGKGGALPCPFSKIGKTCPSLEKKCPNCDYLWVKFLIQNEISKSFQAKKPDIFSRRDRSFSCCRWMFIKLPWFQKNSSALKSSWLRACLGLFILKKTQEWGFLRVTFVCKWLEILLHSEYSGKSLALKVCKPMKGIKIIWCYKIFWSFSWTFCYSD